MLIRRQAPVSTGERPFYVTRVHLRVGWRCGGRVNSPRFSASCPRCTSRLPWWRTRSTRRGTASWPIASTTSRHRIPSVGPAPTAARTARGERLRIGAARHQHGHGGGERARSGSGERESGGSGMQRGQCGDHLERGDQSHQVTLALRDEHVDPFQLRPQNRHLTPAGRDLVLQQPLNLRAAHPPASPHAANNTDQPETATKLSPMRTRGPQERSLRTERISMTISAQIPHDQTHPLGDVGGVEVGAPGARIQSRRLEGAWRILSAGALTCRFPPC